MIGVEGESEAKILALAECPREDAARHQSLFDPLPRLSHKPN